MATSYTKLCYYVNVRQTDYQNKRTENLCKTLETSLTRAYLPRYFGGYSRGFGGLTQEIYRAIKKVMV